MLREIRRWRAWMRVRSLETLMHSRDAEWLECFMRMNELDSSYIDDAMALEKAKTDYLNLLETKGVPA